MSKRMKSLESLEMNPTIVIKQYKAKKLDGIEITVNVVREDLLVGGSKQRAIIKFIEFYSEYDEFVYAGPSSGFAQVALTISCLKLTKRVHLFIQTPTIDPKLTLLCEKMGAKVELFLDGKLSIIEELAKEYVDKSSNEKNKIMLIPFGLDCEVFNNFFSEQLKLAIPSEIQPQRVWLTVGSGTLLRVLLKLWPNTKFMPVRVGKNLWQDQYTENEWIRIGGQERIEKLAAPQKFFESLDDYLMPPYPSVRTYDAKLWQQVIKYAEEGDFIWNVAAEDELLKLV